ncbi:OmpA family protein [Lysobacter antibioticus]|uniref:OmpA family protein n=1 Tax=Lysobacter antibioticus TaxID=84531 RepID=UPI0021BD7E3F|nr:OmpA family protein [Lysobacter antibioticus]
MPLLPVAGTAGDAATATHGTSSAVAAATGEPAPTPGDAAADTAAPASGEPAASADASAGADSRNAKLYFDVGSATPPADAAAELAGVVAALKAEPERKARISGFHDTSGSAATNAELAKQRAQAVQAWLESQGIVAGRIALDKPAVTTGSGDAREARRVEVTVE